MTKILGISAFYHDSAACLIIDGNIIAAVQEERFTRIKHDLSFPINSIMYILESSSLDINQIDYIVFYEKPFLKFDRLIKTYFTIAPRGIKNFIRFIVKWLTNRINHRKLISDYLFSKNLKFDKNKILFCEHHYSHAASAFFPSPFNEAIILTADGVGEWATTTIAIGNKNKLKIVKELKFPHSLGLLYSAFTYYIGFKVNSGEYKLMGLAPYGEPKYADKILNNLIDLKDDGSFRLNLNFFDYLKGDKMINNKFEKLFKQKSRNSNTEAISQFHMDIASSIQFVLEEIILRICKSIKEEYKISNLCLAGGVALNCVVNGKIANSQIFNNIWIQPAASDAGGALGSAIGVWYDSLNNKRNPIKQDQMKGSYLGPKYDQIYVEKKLKNLDAHYEILNDDNLFEKVSNDLSNSLSVGWFQGRMEFGPRALGNRSILADPRSATMQKNLNLKIKFRENFRPFAPSVLREDLSDWFQTKNESPYMLLVSKVAEKRIVNKDILKSKNLNLKRSEIPAVTHVDLSARVQTVDKNINNKFYNLIKAFKKKTNCPVLVNTSFNVRGEPIVNSPEDAFNCFMGTNLDVLVIENCYLLKKKQNKNLMKNYKEKFELD